MNTFPRCSQLRTQAEQGCDPQLYERAAAEFEALGMPASARRCRERAAHYRELHGIPIQIPEQIAIEVR